MKRVGLASLKHVVKLLKTGAQVSLELSVGLIIILILILGSVRLFFWFNENLVKRQQEYEDTRAGTRTTIYHPGHCTHCHRCPNPNMPNYCPDDANLYCCQYPWPCGGIYRCVEFSPGWTEVIIEPPQIDFYEPTDLSILGE